MKKHLGIDMRAIKPFPTGVGSHFLLLIKSLAKTHPEFSLTLIINRRSEAVVKKTFADLPIQYEMIDIHGGSFRQYLLLPYLWIRYKRLHVDLLITDPWCVFPFEPNPYLLIIYDLIGFHEKQKTFKQLLFDVFFFKFFAKRARGIISTLLSGKRDIVNFLKIAPKKVFTVEISVADAYTKHIPNVDKVMSKYAMEGKKYIVYVGNRRPHKNIAGAIKTFSILHKTYHHDDLYFYIIGAFDAEGKEKDGLKALLEKKYTDIQEYIIFLGRIPANAEVAAILKNAVALLHPSKFEGFGLTPLEAMSVGTPVVASSITAISEVVGEAGLLAPAQDAQSHAKSIHQLLTDSKFHALMSKKGLQRAKNFSWDRAADKLAVAINTCMKR